MAGLGWITYRNSLYRFLKDRKVIKIELIKQLIYISSKRKKKENNYTTEINNIYLNCKYKCTRTMIIILIISTRSRD